MKLKGINENLNKEVFDKIVVLNTSDSRRIVFSDVSLVEQINDHILIKKLDKSGKKVQTAFILNEKIQKITIAQNLYTYEVSSEKIINQYKDEEDTVKDIKTLS